MRLYTEKCFGQLLSDSMGDASRAIVAVHQSSLFTLLRMTNMAKSVSVQSDGI